MEFEVQREGVGGLPAWTAADPDHVLTDLVDMVLMCESRIGPQPVLVKGMLRTDDGILCFVKFSHEKELGSTCWVSVDTLSPMTKEFS